VRQIKPAIVLSITGIFLGLFPPPAGSLAGAQKAAALEAFFAKREVTIAVTDSGLGGLSIMAEAAARLKEAKIFESVNLVFFNALFSNDSGYNSLKSREEKIAVFDSALRALDRTCRPDIVLVGCNTLSVLLEETPFFKAAKIPLLGIVEPGVDLIALGFKKEPGATVIILGTETTIAEGEHKKRLLERGVKEERIVVQACPELASYIEKDPAGEDTGLLIESYVEEALARVKDPKAPLYVSLNCTHFGYSLDGWKKAFEGRRSPSIIFLNPNSKMTDVLISSKYANRLAASTVRAKAVSMVEIGRQKIDALGPWLRKISPETADALAGYEWKPDLFDGGRGGGWGPRLCPGVRSGRGPSFAWGSISAVLAR
jgi:glutamate racemase